jgi:hypothetical protein
MFRLYRKNCTILHKKDYIITVYNFSSIKVYKRPDDGSKLEPKHVVVNQLMKLVLCVTDLIHMLVMEHNFFRTKISLCSCYCLVFREGYFFNFGWEIGLWGSLELCQFLLSSLGCVKWSFTAVFLLPACTSAFVQQHCFWRRKNQAIDPISSSNRTNTIEI